MSAVLAPAATAVLTERLLVVAAVAIAVVTLGVGLVTVATAGWYHRQRRRREAARDRMKGQFLERLFDPDPDWEGWVDGLSAAERRAVRTLLEEYLRQLRGSEHERLCELGRALGIQAAARRNLATPRKRFRALTWLALLEAEVPVERLSEYCLDTPRHRAGAARVLYENGHPDAGQTGTDLLVGDGDQPLSAFGLDTLYRLNEGDATPLLSLFPAAAEDWETPLLVQALFTLRYASVGDPDRLEWLLDLLTHESPRVRTAAIAVVERHGWRGQFRQRVDVDRLVTDPDPSVRTDAYLLLASWGDDRSADRLRACLDGAFDTQLLALVRALSVHPRAGLPEPTERTRPVVDWVRADAAVTGERDRVWGGDSAWA